MPQIENNIMFTKEQQKSIAVRFINKHKHASNDWAFNIHTIFNNLESGIYGEVREEFPGEYSIEIGKHESKSGRAEIFEF